MCCQDPPPPPDMTGVAEASEEVARINQQVAMEQLDWARQQDTMNREILDKVLGITLPAMQEQYDQARSDRQRYEEMFRPMEDAFVQEAQNYDTPERRAMERAKSMADVGTQFHAARENALRRLEGFGGVDPTVSRSQALDIGTRTQEAAAKVGAATQADNRVESVGRALKSDAINMGRGALSNAAAFYGQAVNAGQAGVGGANQTTATGAGAAQSAMGWSGQALQGYGQAGNLMTQNFQNQMTGWNANQQQSAGMLQGAGNIAGMGLAMGIADGGPADQAIPYTEEGETIDTGLGDGSGIDDTVPAYLSDGEYVIPADVVRAKGEEFFDKLIERYHTPAAEQRKG